MNKSVHVRVGGGSCGRAAGAEAVFDGFKKQLLESQGGVVWGGCLGLCHLEVLVEVTVEGKNFFYGHVKPNQVSSIIDYHLKGKPLFNFSPLNESQLNFLNQQTRIALSSIGKIDPLSIEEAFNAGAYKAIKRIISEKWTPQQVIQFVKDSGLRGRGGGGFLTAQKWEYALTQKSSQKYVVCNGDEGDPGAFMDRSLLEGDPHRIIEGMMIAGYAIGANQGLAYIRAEYPLAIKHLQKAIDMAHSFGLLGDAILQSSFSFEIKIKQGAGAFVCGEETALLSSLENQRGMPHLRPPFPVEKGFKGKPTVINNVETLANIPAIIIDGPAKLSSLGTASSKGTKVFALAGAVNRGGLVEVPMGLTINELLSRFSGGSKSGSPFKAVQLGGPSGGCLPASLFDTVIDYPSLAATGAIIGSGGLIVLDETTCMVDLALFFLRFTQEESCGKCTFCRLGTLRMKEILEKISEGEGTPSDLDLLFKLALQVQKSSLCGLGQTAPNPILTTLRYFREEYLEHIESKKCRAHICKKLIHHEIIVDKCIACSLCQKVCSANAIMGIARQKGSFSINQELCSNCGMCRFKCPTKAIIVNS